MIVSVHQPQYLPWLGYFDKIRKSDVFVFLDNVQYKKREFQNRNKIRIKDGWIWLTVPVVTKDRFLQKISDVLINNDLDWAHDHGKSIEHNYARAPHFERYASALRSLYDRPWEKLADLNIESIRLLLAAFGISTPIRFESELNITSSSTQRIVDICAALKADTYLSGAGGRDYMDESLFEANGLKLMYQDFRHPEYPQAYGGFEPFMSALDYLLNCGNGSF